jgi:hypothetical protein
MLSGAARYWIAGCFDVYENGTAATTPEIVKTRVSENSDQSFGSYEAALAHFDAAGISPGANFLPDQVWLDIHFEYPLRSANPSLALRTRLAALGVRVSTALKYLAPDGGVRAFSFEGDPGLTYLDASWTQATQQFLRWGVGFSLGAVDLLLFLFCLMLPLRRNEEILPVLTAFTGALSAAFLASAFGRAPDTIWFHPLIETLSAAAILLTAFANIINRVTLRRRALWALGWGFVYGFVCLFDFGAKAQFGGSHAAMSALAFNAGVVIAVTSVVALLVPAFWLLLGLAKFQRVEMIIVSALAADTAWGWLEQRWAQLSKIPFRFPAFDIEFIVIALRYLAVLLLLGGLLWFADGWLRSCRVASGEPSAKNKARSAV